MVSDRNGVSLTDTGYGFLDSIPLDLSDVTSIVYVFGEQQQAVVVHNRAQLITNGADQRDCGSRHGSEGASVFVMRKGILWFPDLWNISHMDPDFDAYVRESGIRDGDVLIIAGSEDKTVSRYAAVSIGLELI